METEEYKAIFKKYFLKTIQEQSSIRKEMIGKSIDAIYYAPKVEGLNVDIKDESVIHVPMGYLTLQLPDSQLYRLNTNYQTWWGGIYGILIERIHAVDFFNNKFKPEENQIVYNKSWQFIRGQRIENIKWNWKTEPYDKNEGKILTAKEALDYLYEDSFLPNNLVFKFENNKSIYFFALEPDAEVSDKSIYTFIPGGEEIMVFLDESKLPTWNIFNKGFEIEIIKDTSYKHNYL